MKKALLLTALVVLCISASALATSDHIINLKTATEDWFITQRCDLNHDGIINVMDMAAIGMLIGAEDVPAAAVWAADLNFDGQITVEDLEVLSEHFGEETIWRFM